MLDKLITFALQQRVFILLLTVALILLGINALDNLPIEAFPDVQDVQVQVVTQAVGQAPEEVERTVTLPIEREMSGVARITQLRSVSITGLSIVTLTFSDGTDDYFARQQVLEKLQNVTLPPGIQPTLAPLSTAVGEIYRYVLEAPANMPISEIRAIQDWQIRPALRMVKGVADVVSFGGVIREYQINANPYALKKYGVTLDQVAQALSVNSANVGGGLLRRGDESLVVRGQGLFTGLDDIAHVVITAKDGKTVQVGDIGEVVIGARPRSGIVAFNDQDNVVEGIVQMVKAQNAAKVVADLKLKIDDINAKLPPGVKLHTIYDRTQLIKHTVHTVTDNLIMGAALVITILIMFLRNWRAALIVASIIPLALLFAFVLMDARGVSANLISLGAVDFGIIIDSAVVLVEALMVRLAAGSLNQAHNTLGWRTHALKQTAIELGHPILFSKAIIILAFLPIFTFQRVEGKIFTPVALTLSFALLGALILTLTLIPTLLSYTLGSNGMAEKHSKWMHKLQQRYRSLLLWAGERFKVILAASLGLLALALAGAPMLGSEFLPKLDEGNIWLTISLPPQTALDKTKDIEREVRAILRSYPEVGNVVTHVGRPDDGTDPKGPNNMEILADLKPRETWHFASKEALIEDMTAKLKRIPGLPTNFSQVIQDNVEEAMSGVKGEISVKVFGPDLEILQDKADQIASILAETPGATDVAAIQVSGQTELNIVLDRAKMGRLGINVADTNSVIQTALGGQVINNFYEGERRFDVTLRLDKRYRDAVDDVANLQVALPNGAGTIALGDIARISVKQGASRISREGGGRNVSVKSNLLGRDQGSFVAEAQQRVKEQVKLPPGYHITWGGQFENQQRAMKRLKIIVPISLFMIFSLLFWAFRSVRLAGLVLMMVPFTLIGGIAGLGLAGLHLSVSAAVGFIAVAGISVQNGVIMMEQIIDLLRNGSDMSTAVLEGAVQRLRPILMTALMAGLGLLPAALSHGIGSETQRPFAVVIVGGIVSATLFTLLLLPLAFQRAAIPKPADNIPE
ncbi:CusA/CzcA family heavy metal efflux RND transporter [Sulfuriferula sp. AH1]|uniref:efflux RND transporter permease subunit n=1 Tax=Sulfuriferula sp. AH1 TaxID=1985873 RepID=UPI000B3B182B|nr:CusA/CzcA family heavy metal efflux RND transporter [Sulfuriferula sp. AH1]ARU30333.1 CusA/CzcA family heavy metal efflux RND transporter [Sulfuriferula sp. AH1]